MTTTPVSERPSVQEAVALVKGAIGAVGKDRQMADGPAKYAYRGIDAILDSAHEALVVTGLVIYPAMVVVDYEMRATRNGNPLQWVTAVVTWSVVGPRGDRLDPPPMTVGEAADTSDKASNKAQTAAFKVLLSQLFAIPYSADDQDDDRHELAHPAPTWSAVESEEANRLDAMLDALPGELAGKVCQRVTARAAEKGLEVRPTQVRDLPASWLVVWRKTIEKAHESLHAEVAEVQPVESAPVQTWAEVVTMPPTELAAHLTALDRSAQGSPRVLRERLGKALGVYEPPDGDPGDETATEAPLDEDGGA